MSDGTEKAGFAKKWASLGGATGALLPRHSGWVVWAETLAITLLTVLICRYASSEDPFFIAAQFPWPLFAPLLVALRYGVLPGIGAAAVLFCAWAAWVPGGLEAEIPKLYFLGSLLVTMVCGEYSGLWGTRLRRLGATTRYLEDRVERITKRIYLLRLSHDRLEQELLSRPVTLRDALADLQQRIAGLVGGDDRAAAQAFVEFLAQYCQLEVAAIYAMRQGDDGTELGAQLGRLGEPPPLHEDDALYRAAVESGHLAHVQTAAVEHHAKTDHLVIAPMTTSGGKMSGVLAVSSMPFFALNEDTLQMMQVLLSAFADGMASAEKVSLLLARYPGCPPGFATEYIILQRIQNKFGVDSHISVLVFGEHRNRTDMFQHVLRQRRTPDVIWHVENLLGRSFVINLMPLAGNAAVEGYFARTQMSLRQSFGDDFSGLNIRPHSMHLADTEPLEAVRMLLLKGV